MSDFRFTHQDIDRLRAKNGMLHDELEFERRKSKRLERRVQLLDRGLRALMYHLSNDEDVDIATAEAAKRAMDFLDGNR